ncbi:hypothetical protein BDK51DRAFT_25582, partial [Blyttiomyces helicus]
MLYPTRSVEGTPSSLTSIPFVAPTSSVTRGPPQPPLARGKSERLSPLLYRGDRGSGRERSGWKLNSGADHDEVEGRDVPAGKRPQRQKTRSKARRGDVHVTTPVPRPVARNGCHRNLSVKGLGLLQKRRTAAATASRSCRLIRNSIRCCATVTAPQLPRPPPSAPPHAPLNQPIQYTPTRHVAAARNLIVQAFPDHMNGASLSPLRGGRATGGAMVWTKGGDGHEAEDAILSEVDEGRTDRGEAGDDGPAVEAAWLSFLDILDTWTTGRSAGADGAPSEPLDTSPTYRPDLNAATNPDPSPTRSVDDALRNIFQTLAAAQSTRIRTAERLLVVSRYMRHAAAMILTSEEISAIVIAQDALNNPREAVQEFELAQKRSAEGDRSPSFPAYVAAIRAYAKAGDLEAAGAVLDEAEALPENDARLPDLSSLYQPIMSGYLMRDNYDAVVSTFRRMLDKKVTATPRIFAILFIAVSRDDIALSSISPSASSDPAFAPDDNGSPDPSLSDSFATMLHRAGIEEATSVDFNHTLVTMYSALGDLDRATRALARLRTIVDDPESLVIPYSALIDASFKRGSRSARSHAESLIAELMGLGVRPGLRTWSAIMSAYSRLGAYALVDSYYAKMLAQGIEPDQQALNVMIRAHARRGNLEAMESVVRRLHELGVHPNVYTTASIMAGYVVNERPDEAIAAFERMQAVGIAPDTVIMNVLMSTCIASGDSAGAIAWLARMKDAGLAPTHVTYTILTHTIARSLDADLDSYIADLFANHDVKPSPSLYGILISNRIRLHDRDAAVRLFNEMVDAHGLEPTPWILTTLASAFVSPESAEAVIGFLSRIEEQGGVPDAHAYHVMMRQHLALQQPGRVVELARSMRDQGVPWTPLIRNTVLTALLQLKDFDAVDAIFDALDSEKLDTRGSQKDQVSPLVTVLRHAVQLQSSLAAKPLHFAAALFTRLDAANHSVVDPPARMLALAAYVKLADPAGVLRVVRGMVAAGVVPTGRRPAYTMLAAAKDYDALVDLALLSLDAGIAEDVTQIEMLMERMADGRVRGGVDAFVRILDRAAGIVEGEDAVMAPEAVVTDRAGGVRWREGVGTPEVDWRGLAAGTTTVREVEPDWRHGSAAP